MIEWTNRSRELADFSSNLLAVRMQMRILLTVALALSFNPVSADQFKIPWKGDYGHNSIKRWSKDNPYDSGFSKNFLNGTPEEGGKVQKDGELWVETMIPENTIGQIPFVIVMHGCMGMSLLTSAWAHHVGRVLNAEGVGVLLLDSFTTRKVEQTCGMSCCGFDGHPVKLIPPCARTQQG